MELFKKGKDKKVVVFVGMEGWSKKGGQADYIRELSDAIANEGHLVLVVNPYFRQPHADISTDKGRYLFTIDLPIGQGSLPFHVFYNQIDNVHYFRCKDPYNILFPIVYPDWYIDGILYSDSLYGYIEAVALSRIAMHIAGELKIRPDVFHFNDWQTGYGPIFVEEIYRKQDPFKLLFKNTGTVITIHNLAYQGLTKWGIFINKNDPIVQLLGKIYPGNGLFIGVYDHGYMFEVDAFGLTTLPRYFQFMTKGGAECWSDLPGCGGRHNVLKVGIEKANKIVAVSKGNCNEMRRDDLGFGLGGVIAGRTAQGAVAAVWNGLNVGKFRPQNLKELNEIVDGKRGIRFLQFDSEDPNLLKKKAKNKIAVRAKINYLIDHESDKCFGHLDEAHADDLLICAVNRLVRQKGYGVLFEPLDYNKELWIQHGERLIDVLMRLREPNGGKIQMVFMGTPGDHDGHWVVEQLIASARRYAGQVAMLLKFDPELANQIRAGSDLFFMPSQYEPGGISNIQASILGSLCIITYTGGLIDFLESGATHLEFVAAPFDYNFPWTIKQTGRDFVRAFKKAMDIFYRDKAQWQEIVKRAMNLPVDWSYKVSDYIKIYEEAQNQLRGDS